MFANFTSNSIFVHANTSNPAKASNRYKQFDRWCIYVQTYIMYNYRTQTHNNGTSGANRELHYKILLLIFSPQVKLNQDPSFHSHDA